MQQEIWRRLASSETTKGIAVDMNLNPKTVEWHRAKLMRAVGKYSYALLVREAIAVGLIELG